MTQTTPGALVPITPKDQRLVGFIQQAATLKSNAAQYVIDSPEMYELGTETLRDIKRTFDEVEAVRDSIVRPMNTAVKNTNALFKPITEALDLAKSSLTRSMLAFENALRDKQRAEEERVRLEREAAMREAEAKLQQAQQEGDSTKAEAALMEGQMASIAGAAPVLDEVDRAGHARRDSYEVIPENLPVFLRWLADQMEKHPDRFDNTVSFKVKQLNTFATDTQGKVPIPGAVVKPKSTLAVRK